MNPDQALLQRFSGAPLAIDSNPLAAALECQLLSLDRTAGVVRLSFNPGPQFVQGRGVVQGGIVSTMLDFAAAFAALSVVPEGQTAATASMTVNFQGAVRAGPVMATGTVERAGKRLIFTRARITGEADRLMAAATAVMSVLPDLPPR
ncbi:MAG: PaaI family thioesterase [Xanthobacteraceae bacterium]